MPYKLLCCGDIHLGCTPSRMPSDLNAATQFSPRKTLENISRIAKQHSVDLVLFSGDLCDSRGAYLEAHGALSQLEQELSQLHIPIVCVAGNHDWHVLPRVLKDLPGIHLLGQGSEWQELLIQIPGKAPLKLLGRSFTQRYHSENPFQNFDSRQILNSAEANSCIGLLHCDFAADSPYFPVSPKDFERPGIDLWVLGHIHKPQILKDSPFVFYPGSLQGLDPSELGARGVWILEIEAGRIIEQEHIPCASLRYENIQVPLTQAEHEDQLQEALLSAVRCWTRSHKQELSYVRQMILRVSLVGNLPVQSALSKYLQDFQNDKSSASFEFEGIQFHIDQIENNTRPAIDLVQLASQSDPPGLLAAELLKISESQNQREFLLQLRQELSGKSHESIFSALDSSKQISDAELVQSWQEVAGELLFELLSQRGAEHVA